MPHDSHCTSYDPDLDNFMVCVYIIDTLALALVAGTRLDRQYYMARSTSTNVCLLATFLHPTEVG